jgi:hypothetical protein
MATWKLRLAEPPPPGPDRRLWLEHAAGKILFEDVRGYALDRLDGDLSQRERAIAETAISDATYGLMMVIQGVTGALRNDQRVVEMGFVVRLRDGDRVEDELDLFEGDGVCMGYHGWIEGDFGADPVVEE